MRVTFVSHVSSKCLCLTFDPERGRTPRVDPQNTHRHRWGVSAGGGGQMLVIAALSLVPVGLTVVRNACYIMFLPGISYFSALASIPAEGLVLFVLQEGQKLR